MTTAFALDTPDLDRAREVVCRMVGPFSLTPCRPSGYRARVRTGRVGTITLADVSYQAVVDIRSAAPDGVLIVEIPVAGFCHSGGARTAVRAGRGAVLASLPGRSIRTRIADRSRLLVARIPMRAIDPTGQWDGGRCGPHVWAPPAALRPDRLASLERLAGLVFDETAAGGPLASNDALGAELQQVLLSLLGIAGWTEGAAPPSAGGDNIVPRSVRRAQALMMAAPAGGMALPALARRCGVSIRTLQENFRQFAGTTPSEWWRDYRLDRVRAALCAGGDGASVTDIAMAFGFAHPGRFAAQYRARFGVPPSETLHRARQGRQR